VIPRVVARFRAHATTWAMVAVALGIWILLVAVVSHDPASGVTLSGSPISDEGWNAVAARNLVLLGRASTDDWKLYFFNLPFTATLTAVFSVFGTGIVQARLATISMVGLAVLVMALGLRRPLGRWPALVAAIAVGTSTLILYYGRLVYLEDLVVLCLVLGFLALGAVDRRPTLAGLASGLAFGLAIGTKPSAALSVAGLWLAVALVDGRRSPAIRRWLVGAAAAIALMSLAWIVAIWAPNRDAVALDLLIWPPFDWPASLPDAAWRLVRFALGRGDDGAVGLMAPAIVFGGAGLAILCLDLLRPTGRPGDPVARSMSAAAIGWLAAGSIVVIEASYHPNRYLVPVIPPLAVLGAAGLRSLGLRLWPRLSRRARTAAVVGLALALAAPGLAAQVGWMASSTSDIPAAQATLAPLVPRGSVVVGFGAPLLLMGAPVTTLIPRAGLPANSGDVYRTAGARWYFASRSGTPPIVDVPPTWSGRRLAGCVTWHGDETCLFEVP
jgi:4-amino-4-deoxy-L-arabinose transferase-like glycosyltransferase